MRVQRRGAAETGLYVFLTRIAAQGVVILAVTMLGLGFPYTPAQVRLTLLTVGVTTLFLTRWASPAPPDGRLLANLGRFVIPAAIVTAGFGTAVYAVLYESVTTFLTSGSAPAQVISDFESYTGLTYGTDAEFVSASAAIGAQTGLSTFFCLASFVLILFLAPPTRFFAAWTRPTDDRRPTLLIGAFVAVFAAVCRGTRESVQLCTDECVQSNGVSSAVVDASEARLRPVSGWFGRRVARAWCWTRSGGWSCAGSVRCATPG